LLFLNIIYTFVKVITTRGCNSIDSQSSGSYAGIGWLSIRLIN